MGIPPEKVLIDMEFTCEDLSDIKSPGSEIIYSRRDKTDAKGYNILIGNCCSSGERYV
jgi:hypothetical protein